MAAPNNLRGLEVSVNDAATTIGPISVIGLNEVRFAAYAMTGEYMGGTGGAQWVIEFSLVDPARVDGLEDSDSIWNSFNPSVILTSPGSTSPIDVLSVAFVRARLIQTEPLATAGPAIALAGFYGERRE